MIGFYIYCGVLAGLTMLGVAAWIRSVSKDARPGKIADQRDPVIFWNNVEPFDEPPPAGWCREV